MPLESYERFSEAFGLEANGDAQGMAEESEQLLDD
jgi:hypothetical protein